MCKINLKLFCINTFVIKILILQSWKQMDKFHNKMKPFSGIHPLSSQYTDIYYYRFVLVEIQENFLQQI